MMRSFFLLLVVCLLGFVTRAQEVHDEVDFSATSFDFGRVSDRQGKKVATFNFVYTGKDSLAISNVSPDCGCIISDWSKGYLQIGDTGSISIQYDPLNRPGAFEKKVDVNFSNGSQTSLLISGFVASPEISIEKLLSYASGSLRFKTSRINMGNVASGSTIPIVLTVVNEADKVITLDSLASYLPPTLHLSFKKRQLLPKQYALINGWYKAPDATGYYEHAFHLATDDVLEKVKAFEIVANVYSSAEDDSTAQIDFNKSIVDFGSVGEGELLETTFTITNVGSSELEVSSIVPNCSCITADKSEVTIKPQESVNLLVQYDTSKIKGRQYKTFHLYSNAQNGSIQQLVLFADIK